MSITDWQTTIPILIALVLLLLKAIDYSVSWGKLQQRTYVQAEFELLKLDKKEPKRSPWRAFNIVTLVFCSLTFVYDFFFVKALISVWANNQLNSSWISLLLVFVLFVVVLPIYLFWDSLIGILRKQTKTEWSATLQVNGESSNVFKHCQIILLNIGASLTSLDKDSKKVLAQLGRYEILVKVETTGDDGSSILVESRTVFPTIIPDFHGGNRRNIQELVKGFYKLRH
jgi:hypothetical protein